MEHKYIIISLHVWPARNRSLLSKKNCKEFTNACLVCSWQIERNWLYATSGASSLFVQTCVFCACLRWFTAESTILLFSHYRIGSQVTLSTRRHARELGKLIDCKRGARLPHLLAAAISSAGGRMVRILRWHGNSSRDKSGNDARVFERVVYISCMSNKFVTLLQWHLKLY